MKRSMYACGALFAVLGATMIAGGAVTGGGAVTLLALGVIFLPCAGLFLWVGSWGVMDTAPLPDDQLERFGRPAPATVLEVEAPELSAGGEGGARLTLEVTPRNESSFRTRVTQPASRPTPPPPPLPGEVVSVKFDPNKRKRLIVVDAPPGPPKGPIVIAPWARS